MIRAKLCLLLFIIAYASKAKDSLDSLVKHVEEDAKQLLGQIAENEKMEAEDKKYIVYRTGFPSSWKTVSEPKEAEINKSLQSFEALNKRGIYVMFGYGFHYVEQESGANNIKLYIEKTKEIFKEAIKESNVTVLYVLRVMRYEGQASTNKAQQSKLKIFHYSDIVLSPTLESTCRNEILKEVQANLETYSFSKDGDQAISKYTEITKEKVKGCGEKQKATLLKPEYGNGSIDKALEYMQLMADAQIPYKYGGGDSRTSVDTKGLEEMDCSEFVGRYLNSLGVYEQVPNFGTSSFSNTETADANFKGKLKFVEESDQADFKDIRPGDFFVYSGHMGLVKSYDATTDIVTILEAIGISGSREESLNINSCKGCVRESKYHRTKAALFEHDGWVGYYRPITQ